MRRTRRNPSPWAAWLLLFTLMLGWGAEAVGDCDREELGAASGIICLHGEGSSDCGNTSQPAAPEHHHGVHCLCPCHGLTIAPHAPAFQSLSLVAFVRSPLPAGLSMVDLPSPLRPPIAG